MDDVEEYADFMVKYKEWVSIRKLGIRSYTTPQDVVFHLAGIRTVIDTHATALLGIKTSVLDAFAKAATSGLKKKDISLAVAKLDSPEAKKAITDSCASNSALEPMAKSYLLNKIITELGLLTGVDQLAMCKIFPELKPPKIPGMGRKKKAAPEADA
ncbi:MAG: DUF2666 family protein [Candidatus Micrarchaeales archaeon]